MRQVYSKNPILGYLNINYFRNKIVSLRDVVAKVPIDILRIHEIKLDNSFPHSQFLIENYQFPPFRWGRNSKRWWQNCLCKTRVNFKKVKEF